MLPFPVDSVPPLAEQRRIADILAINVEENDEGIRVVISIVESKYVGASGLAAARRGSKDQLLQTLDKFREALIGGGLT